MGSHRIEPSLVLQNAAKAEKDRTLGLFDLTILGVGAIIGTGILVLTGIVAAQDAGPAVTLSFLIAATASCLIGLCYAELTTSIPNSGGAYIYTWFQLAGCLPSLLAGPYWGSMSQQPRPWLTGGRAMLSPSYMN